VHALSEKRDFGLTTKKKEKKSFFFSPTHSNVGPTFWQIFHYCTISVQPDKMATPQCSYWQNLVLPQPFSHAHLPTMSFPTGIDDQIGHWQSPLTAVAS